MKYWFEAIQFDRKVVMIIKIVLIIFTIEFIVSRFLSSSTDKIYHFTFSLCAFQRNGSNYHSSHLTYNCNVMKFMKRFLTSVFSVWRLTVYYNPFLRTGYIRCCTMLAWSCLVSTHVALEILRIYSSITNEWMEILPNWNFESVPHRNIMNIWTQRMIIMQESRCVNDWVMKS